jgi:hypothetical protein
MILTGFIWPGIGTARGLFKHGNEPLCFIKMFGHFSVTAQPAASQEGLSFRQLFTRISILKYLT